MQKTKIFHSVFFQFKDSSDSVCDAFVGDCRKYLSIQPGVLSFNAGRIVEEHRREVNMTDFHVSIHIIFESKKRHDDYQSCDDHNVFVGKNKDNWGTVRVYDAYIQ